jgi:hypothetical protein
MTETIGAAKGERTEARLSYRSSHYSRSLISRAPTAIPESYLWGPLLRSWPLGTTAAAAPAASCRTA